LDDDQLDEASSIVLATILPEATTLPEIGAPDPFTAKEALDGPYKLQWKQAMDQEMKQHAKNGTFTLTELPAGHKAIDGKWVFKVKRNESNEITKFKARLVAKGFMQQYGIDYGQTTAGVVTTPTTRTIFALAAMYDLEIIQIDFVTAYLNSHIEEEVYMRQPPEYVQNGKEDLVLRINKGLYGLKQSARAWAIRLTTALKEFGFKPLQSDPNVFNKGGIKDGITITVYVDDVAIIGKDKAAINQVIDQLRQQFDLTELGPIKHYLGMEIRRDRSNRTISLSQKAYIEKILDKYGYKHGRTAKTPMLTGQKLDKFEGTTTEASKLEFAAQIGAIIYAMTITRPDTAYAASSVAQHAANPGPEHWKALKRIYDYLRSTIDYRLTLGGTSGKTELVGYSDASYAEDPDTRRSTGAYIFTINDRPISWASKRQPTVALSTTEAEYMALCQAIREAIWLRQMLAELGIQTGKIPVNADNKSAIALGRNPEFHKRSKHIDVQYHFVREKVQSGQIDIPYLPTAQMVADGLTKALSPELHAKLVWHCQLNPDQVYRPRGGA